VTVEVKTNELTARVVNSSSPAARTRVAAWKGTTDGSQLALGSFCRLLYAAPCHQRNDRLPTPPHR